VTDPAPDDATTDLLDLLQRGEVRPLGLMPRASNYTFLAEVTLEDRQSLAVYKPRDGEAPLWDFPEGTLCRREVAAFEVARTLGWPAVPPTILRDGPLGPGSIQAFVRSDPSEHFFTLRDDHPEEFRRVAAFDVVVNNADRKAGHCLLGEDGRIWLVDHGVCFSAEPKLRTVIWDFEGEPFSSAICADLRRLREEVSSGTLGQRLAELLSRREVDGIRRRTEVLLETGRFPPPTGRRPYPWPPV
jgi:uncharacterized repeat protein (TIGR03843 family)